MSSRNFRVNLTPYQPKPLPPKGLDLARLITAVGEANAALATYNGLLQAMINPAVLLSPLTNQEAVLSSRIEGTQATVEEVLEHEAGGEHDESTKRDIQDILNYRKALLLAEDSLGDRPLSLAFVRQLHGILMDSVRGQDKAPGAFRVDQNWIGRPGCSIEEASYVPPEPLQLPDYLQAWEAYLQDSDFDPLAQTAIMHAQFELLHPFKDGNGRVGRLLIPLFLFSKHCLARPMFYMSAWLEKHRQEYYAQLSALSAENDWTGWIAFFLRGMTEQAKDNRARAEAIISLYEQMKQRVRDITHSQHSAAIVDALFAKPIFRIADLAESADIPKPTAHALVRQLTDQSIVSVLRPGSGRRAAIIAFPQLLRVAEGDSS